MANAQAPDPKSAAPPAGASTLPHRDEPLLRVTAGGPDHKALLKALIWVKRQAALQRGDEDT